MLLGLIAEASPRGWDGFLGTRASLMMDLVVVAMALVLPVMWWSIGQVRRGRYVLHRRVQIVLSAALLIAVVGFEIDVRLNGWQARATGGVGSPTTAVWTALWIHLAFAISTALLWPVVVWRALRNFPTPPRPAEHSASHRRWGRLAAWDMTGTAVTGWGFYWLAFGG